MVQSANDAAFAIAEHIGGSVEGFVEMMNREAKGLGMNNSEFHSPHGLPPDKGGLPDKVSAHDFGILSKALIEHYPQSLALTKTVSADFRDGKFKMSNHNHLLKSFPGCDGIKTGFYRVAGFSISTTAERNGSRVIAVVMGCRDRKKRDAEAARLMATGFAQVAERKAIKKMAAEKRASARQPL
jgi:serine-type D-Ala-D-Ala carboxypeptidase (penicillin-binding protein 5/6)